jgi:hypothetical protein
MCIVKLRALALRCYSACVDQQKSGGRCGMFILLAIVLYVLVSIFSNGAETGVRWKAPVLAMAWVALSQTGSKLATSMAQENLGFEFALSMAWLAAMLFLLWIALTYWCRLPRSVSTKVTAAFGAAVTVLIVALSVISGQLL